MTSIFPLFTAIKARFLHAHSSLIQSMHLDLLRSCDDLLLSEFVNCSRSFWHWPSIVSSIIEGAQSVFPGTILDDHELSIREIVDNAITEANSTDGKIQKRVYKSLFHKLHSSNLTDLLNRRSLKYLPNDLNLDLHSINWSSVFALATSMSTQVAVACLKTAIGSWLTTRRLQADLRVCPFCQQHEDSLQHFWNCDLLWLYVSQSFAPFYRFLGDPLALFGLSPISPYQLFGIHIAFHAYHALRHQANITQNDFSAYCRVLLRPCSLLVMCYATPS